MTNRATDRAGRIPAGVWALGFVSLLMDVSSEMIHSLLPLFMVTTLGTSALTVGLVEGLAESTSLVVKVFSGVVSDYAGRRKALALAGYGLSAFTKPLFAVATSASMVLTARLVDRVGKGIRGAPRDALVADLTPPELRGAAFGLRQSLDTVGAVAGPLVASALMLLWAGDFRRVFWVAAVPGALSVLLLQLGVRERDHAVGKLRPNPLSRQAMARLGTAYWQIVWLGGAIALARFSEAFLVLRAGDSVPIALVPLVMVVMNVVYAATAYPFGRLSDRVGPRRLLGAGLVMLAAADLVLAAPPHWTLAVAGVSLWGLHLGITQGLLAAMVAGSSPADLRGTAFGVFNLVSGVALLGASLLAGLLWDRLGPPITFAAGALLSLAALTLLARRGGAR